MSEVVSVRVRKETKEALERAGIDVALKTREYLEELAWETRNRTALTELHTIVSKSVKPSKQGSAQRLLRGDRDAHS
jgi:hypothetical protein